MMGGGALEVECGGRGRSLRVRGRGFDIGVESENKGAW